MYIKNISHLFHFPNRLNYFGNSIKAYITSSSSDKNFISIKNLKITLSNKMGIETGYHPTPKDRSHLLKYMSKSQEELPKRSMQDSFIAGLIPLSTDKKLQDKYVSFLGHVRIGRLLEDMDIFAVFVAYKHILNPKIPNETEFPYTLVTALVDNIVFTDYTTKPQEDIKISGHVSWVGKSSLEVVVWLEQMANDVWNKITRALFVLAARNSTNTGPAIINAIEPADDRERAILSGGEDRKKKRIELMKSHILKVMPSNDEQKIIYDLYSRSTSMEGRQRFLPPGAVWMKDGTLSSIVFPHPEDRNLHNTVFGGFIMRHAAELAWVLGYRYSKYRPKLKSISDINFQKPLAVYIPTSSKRYTSNTIHFTYQVPEVVNEILPLTYEDAMMYIHGKRHFDEVMTDKKE